MRGWRGSGICSISTLILEAKTVKQLLDHLARFNCLLAFTVAFPFYHFPIPGSPLLFRINCQTYEGAMDLVKEARI